MSEELDPQMDGPSPEMQSDQGHEEGTRITRVSGMYEDYFLDYASYVILERAVPALNDGLKPVQRRLLHAMKEMDDGRYHKVANIIGQTMRFSPARGCFYWRCIGADGAKRLAHRLSRKLG